MQQLDDANTILGALAPSIVHRMVPVRLIQQQYCYTWGDAAYVHSQYHAIAHREETWVQMQGKLLEGRTP